MDHLTALFRPTFPILAASLALAACSQPADDAPQPAPAETVLPVEPDNGIGDGAGPPLALEDGAIPAALHGRWGLVPADCTSTRGDAKGLIEISGEGIRFYESRATVGPVSDMAPERIRAEFAFTGEGQTWSRDMALALDANGGKLVRSEYGEDALAEPLTYTRCD